MCALGPAETSERAVRRQNVFPGRRRNSQAAARRDWAATPLGPTDGWPLSLKALVKTLLASRYPMVLL